MIPLTTPSDFGGPVDGEPSAKSRIEEAMRGGHAIVVENLEKTYANGTKAVRGITLRVREGEIFGILGPNGAGKSTTIGVLGTLIRPSAGRAFVDGIDVAHNPMAVRRRIGFAMQEAGVDDLATGREFLRLQGRLYGIPKETAAKRADQLLKLFELDGAADKQIRGYSGGMKRRIDLAAALIHLPRILFFDEPSEGLDPRTRRTLWTTMRRIREQLKATILLTTHYMEEADHLCDRIAIIDQGVIVAQDTPKNLKATVGGQSVVLEFSNGDASTRAEAALSKTKLANRMSRANGELTAFVSNASEAAPLILRALDKAKVSPDSLRIQQPTLDDVYLKFTGHKLEAAEATKP